MMEVALANTVSGPSSVPIRFPHFTLVLPVCPANQELLHLKQTAYTHYVFVRITSTNPAEACLMNKHCKATRYFSSWQQGAQQEVDELIVCIPSNDGWLSQYIAGSNKAEAAAGQCRTDH
jgi:hypothetical protein